MTNEERFVNELIGYIFAYPDDDYMTTECLCRKLLKHGLIDKVDGYYEPKDEPQTDAFTKWAKSVADSYRDEPQTDVTDINDGKKYGKKYGMSSLHCVDCTHYGDYEICIKCDDNYSRYKSYYEPKDEPQTERSE